MESGRLKEVVEALTNKGVKLPCPRCNLMKFSIVGETQIPLQENPNVITIGGPSIPTVIIACDNCGYITQHATLPLGLVKGDK